MFQRRLSLALATLALSLAGCGGDATATSSGAPAGPTPAAPEVNPGGDIPDTQAYVAFTLPSAAASVKTPEGWARSDSGAVVTFSSHFNSVRVESVQAASAPTVASAQSVEVAAIQQQGSAVTIGAVTSVVRGAGTAILITYQANSAADPVTGRVVRLAVERYEFWRSGTEAILTLSAPAGADNVDPWRIISNSFQWQ